MKRELETVKENEKREITGRKRERVRMETESVHCTTIKKVMENKQKKKESVAVRDARA